MNNFDAYCMGKINRNQEMMVFDWDKAATIIKEKGAQEASAGLAGDWEWTGGDILLEGKPVPENETYVYLGSTWAKPEIQIDFETIDCYRMQRETPNWDAKTYWPKSALRKLINTCCFGV